MRPENYDACSERRLSDIVFCEPDSLENDTGPERVETSVPDLQERIVCHRTFTLAGIECGSMFRVDSDPHSILQQISELEFGLPHMGVRLDTLVIDAPGACPMSTA